MSTPMSRLVILPNVGKFAVTNTWHQEVAGVKLLTNTVNTVRRIGLVKHGDAVIPMQVEQSLMLQSTGEVLTPGCTKYNRQLYTKLEGGSTTRELRNDGNRHGAVLPAGYAGETTFKFKFNITCARDVSGGDSNTLVRLRYSVVGHPEIYVETEPFRLVAKEDRSRVARAAANASAAPAGSRKSNLPAAIKHLMEAQRMLEREIDTLGNAADAPQQVLGDCQQKLTYVVAQINQLSSRPSNVAAAASPVHAARDDAPTPETTTEDEQPLGEAASTSSDTAQNWSEDEFNDAFSDVVGSDLQQARSSPASSEAVVLSEVADIWSFINTNYLDDDDEAGQLQLRSLGGGHGGATTAQQPPKRQRLAAAAALVGCRPSGDEPMAFRSCAAPGDADDAPPMMRGLSDATPRAAAAPPVAAAAAAAVAAAPPLPVQRLQSLLRGAWRQTKRDCDSPAAKVRARLAAIVHEVLSRHRAQQAFDLAETLDELNDLKEYLVFNGDD